MGRSTIVIQPPQGSALPAIATIATSLAIGGAAHGTDALAWTGTATGSGALTAGSFIPTSSTVPTNGMYLSAANTVSLAANSTASFSLIANALFGPISSGPRINNLNASSTTPTFMPNRQDTTTGIGAQAAGNISLIAGATERVRVATAAASVSDVLLPGALFTGGTGTTTFPQIFVQPTGTSAVTTWSTSGTIIGANVVSGFAGNFLDFHVAGGASLFSVNQNGALTLSGQVTTLNGFAAGANALINWTGHGGLTSPAAGSIQLGAADAASPVAQTLRVQSVVAGTTDTAGANWTIAGSVGTGTGVGGSLIFQTAPAGSTASTQNALTNALTLGTTNITVGARNFIFATDNAQDIGAVGANRPRNIYVAGSVTASGSFIASSTIVASTGAAIPAGGLNTTGFKFSSTANYGVFFGSGAPTLSAAKGSLYLRSDGSGTTDRMYVNTDGAGTWTAVVTAL